MKPIRAFIPLAFMLLAACGTNTATPDTSEPITAPNVTAFSANPTTISAAGQAVALSWSVSGIYDSLQLTDSYGQTVSVAGTAYTVYPTQSTSYRLTATNDAGSDFMDATVTLQGDTTEPPTPPAPPPNPAPPGNPSPPPPPGNPNPPAPPGNPAPPAPPEEPAPPAPPGEPAPPAPPEEPAPPAPPEDPEPPEIPDPPVEEPEPPEEPTGTLEIKESVAYSDEDTSYVIGTVTNNSSASVEFVKIVASLYDAGESFTGSDFTYSELDILLPGETSPFKMYVFDNPEFQSYSLQVQGRTTTEQAFRPEVNNLNLSGDTVTGQVSNTTGSELEFVKIALSCYKNGELVDTDFAYTDLDTLSSGQSSPFTTYLLSGYDRPDRCEAIAQGRVP